MLKAKLNRNVGAMGVCLLASGLVFGGCASGVEDGSGPVPPGEESVAESSDALTNPCQPGYKLQCTSVNGKVICGCGYVVPKTESGTVVPDFYITHVIYAPPGKSSRVSYSSSNSVGSTTSSTKSFKDTVSVSAKVNTTPIIDTSSVTVTYGETWGNSRTDAVDVSVQTSLGHTKNGQVDAINHAYDEIWFLIRPIMNVLYTAPTAGLPERVDWQFAANQDGVNHAIQYFVYAGWLNGAMAMPADVKATLDAYGLTASYYPALLGADPLAAGTQPNQMMDQARYDYLGEFPFEPPFAQGDVASTQTFSIDQKTTNSKTATSEYSYSVGLTVSGTIPLPLFATTLTASNTWTWSGSSSTKESNGSGSTDSLTVGQPAYGYSGPTILHVYEDTIYKTYAFTLDFAPGCAGSCGGQSPLGCYCDSACQDYGDCCPDVTFHCGSCENACGGQSPSGCWCDSSCSQFGDCCSDSHAQCG